MVKTIPSEEKTIGLLAHLLGLFTSFVGPLIIFLVKGDKKGFAYENAKHALNFQISLIIYMFGSIIISIILMVVLIGFLLIFILPWGLGIFALIVSIIGTVKASQGEIYKYPMEIPFIR